MRKNIYCWLLSSCFCMASVAQIPQHLKADTVFHDFETGELYAWEQYPYAQDIGYDALFFARTTPTLNKSKYALAHPVKAYDTHELYQGFTRKLNSVASAGALLETHIYLQSDRPANELELSFGTTTGKRYFYQLGTQPANEWITVRVPLSEFKNSDGSLPLNSGLEAITIQAKYDTTYYLYTYTVLMDDFRLMAARPKRLLPQLGNAYRFDAFEKTVIPVLGDEALSELTFHAEDDHNLKSLAATLYAPGQQQTGSKLLLKKQAGNWKLSLPVNMRSTSGIWKMELTGIDEQGGELKETINLIVGKHPKAAHPRLFIPPGWKKTASPAAAAILQKAMADTTYLKYDLANLKEGVDRTGENLVGGPYAQNTVGFDAYAKWHQPMSTLEKVIENAAFRYAIAGDQKAGDLGKRALLQLCAYKKWNANWMLNRKFWTYYPVGYAIKAVAYGYDMLYDLLSEEERKMVRTAMIEKGLKMFHRDMVEMNRMPSNLTNHIAVLVSGMGLAAASMYGDDPGNKDMDKYLAGVLTKTLAFINNTYYQDGSYGEPKAGYMDMATRDLAEWMAGLEGSFGIDLSSTTDVENYYKFPLYATDEKGLIPAYGDGGRYYTGFTQEHAQWFVHKTGNPFLYKYVQPYWAAGNGGFLGYIWYRDDIQPALRAGLPASRPFSAQGMLMRSGWDSSATVISTRTGPHSNHYHFDQGSFQIMTNGEELLTDPGIGTGGYYMNTEFQSYNTQSIAHNVLLVDYDPGSQIAAHFDNGIGSLSDWPTMNSVFNGSRIDAVTADLPGVYKNKLNRYNRHLIYRKNGPVFLWDEVTATSGQQHAYSWLFHVPLNEQQRACKFENNRFTVDLPKAKLTMDVAFPKNLTSSIRDRNGNTTTYINYNSKNFSESFLTLSTPEQLPASDFLAVLLPEAKTGASSSADPVTTALEGDGWKGVQFTRGNVTDRLYCNTSGGQQFTTGELSADARYLLVTDSVAQTAYFFSGRQLKTGTWQLNTSKPQLLYVQQQNTHTRIECETSVPDTLQITLPRQPKTVSINGKSIKRVAYKNNILSIQLPVGLSTIEYE